MVMKKKIIKHLRDDIKDFSKEAQEDRKLINELKEHKVKKKVTTKMKKAGKKAGKALKKMVKKGKEEMKIEKVMMEFKEKKLHSGSKKGPRVTKPKQAIAIALSEARKVVSKRKK